MSSSNHNTSTTTTTCTACTDSLPPPTPYLLIDSSPLCHTCFRHLFALAIESESSFPASWASHPLSADRYAHILGPTLVSAYRAKEIEYACPAQERVFCSRTDPPRRPEPCGTFVGRWRETGTDGSFCVRCEKCAWYTCLRCEETFSTGAVEGPQAAIAHECDPSRDKELGERVFAGLKRGRDWQFCPNEGCKRRVQLKDGCNHVRCVCRTHFCFVCGAFVRDAKGLWRRVGGCPRFGLWGDRRAIYDEGDVWDDNGDVEEVDREMIGEEEGLRRAFEVQMRLVEETRRELEMAEARRLRDRERMGGNIAGGPDGDVDEPQRRRRRRRRRRPHENVSADDERRRTERREIRSRRAGDDSPEHPPEAAARPRRGFRAFLNDAIEATDYVLFGSSPSVANESLQSIRDVEACSPSAEISGI
jgi:hypothetical protein